MLNFKHGAIVCMSAKIGSEFSYVELSKIENDRLDVCDMKYNPLIQTFCDLFNFDLDWFEQIRQQTEPQSVDLSVSVFPAYVRER